MKYKVITASATQKLATMISCVKKGKDLKKRDIDTWGIVSSDRGEVFVHTRDQWDKKCGIYCKLSNQIENNTINVECLYWEGMQRRK